MLGTFLSPTEFSLRPGGAPAALWAVSVCYLKQFQTQAQHKHGAGRGQRWALEEGEKTGLPMMPHWPCGSPGGGVTEGLGDPTLVLGSLVQSGCCQVYLDQTQTKSPVPTLLPDPRAEGHGLGVGGRPAGPGALGMEGAPRGASVSLADPVDLRVGSHEAPPTPEALLRPRQGVTLLEQPWGRSPGKDPSLPAGGSVLPRGPRPRCLRRRMQPCPLLPTARSRLRGRKLH